MVDLYPRYIPVLDPRLSYHAENVVQTLQQICAATGYPKTIRVDQGLEFISRDLAWRYKVIEPLSVAVPPRRIYVVQVAF